MRSAIQYTGKKISSINRSALAGPTRVRAYSSDVFSADDSLFVSADWVFNAPNFFGGFKDMIKPFVFIDSAYGKQYSVDSAIADVTSNLTDVGFGFQFIYKDNLNGNLHFAFPVAVNDKVKKHPVSNLFLDDWRTFIENTPYGKALSLTVNFRGIILAMCIKPEISNTFPAPTYGSLSHIS